MVTSTFTGGHTTELVNPVKQDNIDRLYIDSSGPRQISAPKLSHAYVQYDTAAAPASSSFCEDLYIHSYQLMVIYIPGNGMFILLLVVLLFLMYVKY